MRPAIRFLLRRPVFALTAILTIALGIGANTALFGVIYSVVLRPLPFHQPDQLVQIWQTHPTIPQLQVTAPDVRDWRDQSHSFQQIAAYTFAAFNNITLLGQGEPVVVHATMASSNLFPTLGVQPVLGRTFHDSEEATLQRVAVLSENLWRRKFSADPQIVGRTIRLQDDSYQVIGVVSQHQAFPEWADLWIPLSFIGPQYQNRRKFHPLEIVARLKPGVTIEQAQTEMRTFAIRTAQAHPDTNGTLGISVVALSAQLTNALRPSLLLAWAAVGLVLLIACANLGHLFLARMIERRQEMAIREALGAKPWHLIRQLLAESLLIAALGGIAGVALALTAFQFAGKLSAVYLGNVHWSAFEAPVWLFAIAISLIAGVLFGLPACWQVLRPRKRLAETGRSIIRSQSRLSAVLIACEVAMALLVLSGAALLTRSFAALLNEEPGFQATHVWTIPNLPLRNDFPKSTAFFSTHLEPALRGVTGVLDVAAVNSAPMTLGPTEHTRFATRFGIEGRTFDTGSYPVAQNRWMTPEYFRTLAIPLRGGRYLTEDDRNQPRIVVNEALARRFFPGQNAVGKRLALGVMDPQPQLNLIIGVVGDVRDLGLEQPAAPTLYGIVTAPVMTILVKTADGSSAVATALRNAISRADPEIPVTTIQPLQQNLSDSVARRRSAVILLIVFGAIAALLTAGGIYGMLTHSVSVRVREFGVRAAVGAAPGELVAMILRQALALTLPGLILGIALSLAFARVMKSLVYQVSPVDPLSIAGAGFFLLVLTFLSAWLPARKAAALDPALALRTE